MKKVTAQVKIELHANNLFDKICPLLGYYAA